MSDKKLETLILAQAMHSDEFRRKVLSKTKKEFFQFDDVKAYFLITESFFGKYGSMPTVDALDIEITNQKDLRQDTFEDLKGLNKEVFSEKFQTAVREANSEWLLKQTETYYRTRAIYNAIMSSIDIIDGTNKKIGQEAIPEILQDALNVTFDDGDFHDYFEDAEERWAFFHQPDNRIPFKLKMLNFLTKGGLLRKTLNIFVAPTGVGKTMMLCDEAAHWVMSGLNVLYITCEMSAETISQRIDANLMDLEVDDITGLPLNTFVGKIQKLKGKTVGRLIVKEFSPGVLTASEAGMIIDDLKERHDFIPDVVVLDYLNLTTSSRVKASETNSYTLMKNVSEEWRGLAKKKDFALVTATQTNRQGQNASDFELNEVSEGHSVSMTADSMFGMISTEELERINQMRIKVLKNRYGAMNPGSFLVGIERAKMKMYDVDTPNEATTRMMEKRDAGKADAKAAKSFDSRLNSKPKQERKPLEY